MTTFAIVWLLISLDWMFIQAKCWAIDIVSLAQLEGGGSALELRKIICPICKAEAASSNSPAELSLVALSPPIP